MDTSVTEQTIGIIAVIFVSLIWLALTGFATDLMRKQKAIGIMSQTIIMLISTIVIAFIAYFAISYII